MRERPVIPRERLPEQPESRDGRCVRDNRHRLVCRQCGRTENVGCAIGDQSCLTSARAAGFTVDGVEVVFWGLCPACQTGAVPLVRDRKGLTPPAPRPGLV